MQRSLFVQPLDVQQTHVSLQDIQPPTLNGAQNALIHTVRDMGVLQPVVLKPSSSPFYAYEIVDGNRRVYSSLTFEKDTIPAVITDGTTGQLASARAILNLSRAANPVQEAIAIRDALKEAAFTIEDLAKAWGVDVEVLRKRARLLDLPEDVLAGVGTFVSVGTLQDMANLAPDYRDRAVKAYRETLANGEKKFTAKDLKQVKTVRHGDLTLSALGALGALAGPSPLLQVDPAEQLAAEVRRLCEQRGVNLSDLLTHLGVSQPVPVVPTPAPARVNLGQRRTN